MIPHHSELNRGGTGWIVAGAGGEGWHQELLAKAVKQIYAGGGGAFGRAGAWRRCPPHRCGSLRRYGQRWALVTEQAWRALVVVSLSPDVAV